MKDTSRTVAASKVYLRRRITHTNKVILLCLSVKEDGDLQDVPESGTNASILRSGVVGRPDATEAFFIEADRPRHPID